MKTNLPVLKTPIRFLMTMLCVATAILLGGVPVAQAGYIVTLDQAGSDVVATGSGAINLTGLFLFHTGPQPPAVVWPSFGLILTGPTNSGTIDLYIGATGPTSFGRGNPVEPNTGSGDFVGIQRFSGGLLYVPQGYVSGAALSDSMTFNDETLASLGVIPGTYVWSWGAGADQRFTLQIGGVADSGSTVGLLLLGLAALFGASRLRLA
jgi:hypothetical protein